jgi:hypothetical protein
MGGKTNWEKASKDRLHAVLFESCERFAAFKNKIQSYGIDCTVLNFDENIWIDFDYSNVDMMIYYPSFQESSNHPLALSKVYDNLTFLQIEYPLIAFYPDPHLSRYYNDKYKQFLYLYKHRYPIPETIPLLSEKNIEQADKKLGYPMVLKNRFGAGGGSVFLVNSKKELLEYFELAQLNFFSRAGFKHIKNMLSKRIFYYWLIKAKRLQYPFLSYPLLAQKFVHIDRDLKTVVNEDRVVEGHWRLQSDPKMWKMNIDGGGTGVWGYIPNEALEISVRLSQGLGAKWLNLDLIQSNGEFLITEFSPVWHHYAYKEKPNFIYQDDYNIQIPLDISLDLEQIILESLIEAAKTKK